MYKYTRAALYHFSHTKLKNVRSTLNKLYLEPTIRPGLANGIQLDYNSTYMNIKNIVIVILALVLIGVVVYLLNNRSDQVVVVQEKPTPTEPAPTTKPQATSSTEVEKVVEERGGESIIGTSADGNKITAYHFGTGPTEILFIGGVHGGYSWDTTILAYELVDFLDAQPSAVPKNVTVTVIPVANPDGLKATVGTYGRFEATDAMGISDAVRSTGRFNANEVDLNRNFDCEWSATGQWQKKTVSGGTAPFSEPEAKAIRDYVDTYEPAAAVVWFSSEGKVYPSSCGGQPSADSTELAKTFAKAANYPTGVTFSAYPLSGDMVNWMAKQGVPAISVLLTAHNDPEWNKNLAGVKAVLAKYAE